MRKIFFTLFYCLLVLIAFGQNDQDVEIIVTSDDGIELIGVNAVSNDQSFIGITGINGEVLIPGELSSEIIIEFSYLGFKNQSFSVSELRDTKGKIRLAKDDKLLDEVIVIGRNDLKKESIPYTVSTIDARLLKSGETQSSADALSKNANVFVQKSQMGGGSPIIRGFEANKVLLVVDGVRMNNAIYRSGHLQNAITVDQQMLDRIEVIYGPASLTYGSDALGGVVHFRTINPGFSSKGQGLRIQSSYLTRFSSANQEKLGHLNVSIGGKSWASLTSFSYADFGHLRSGANFPSSYPDFGKRSEYVVHENGEDKVIPNDDPTVQHGTAYHQYDLFQKFLVQISPRNLISMNIQYSSSSDIPRYDQLSEYSNGALRFAEWYYGPQDRLLFSLKWSGADKTKFYDRINAISAFQFIEEDRVNRSFGASNRSHQLEDVFVYSLTLDMIKELDPGGDRFINYGVEVSHNDVFSKAYDEDIYSGVKNYDVFTRYPDAGSDMNDVGVYANLQWPIVDSLLFFNGGLRYSYHHLNALYSSNSSFEWPSEYYTGIGLSNRSLTWSAGLILQPLEGWRIQLLSGSAFRAPNVDDFAKVRVKGSKATVPNPDLIPEQSINFELGTSFRKPIRNISVEIGGNVFYTNLKNAIVRSDYHLENGAETIIIGGETYNVQANVNADNAFIYGFSGQLNFWFVNAIQWENNINYTYGRSFDQNNIETPLSHIPPIFGKSSLAYHRDKWMFKSMLMFNGAKKLEDFAPEGSSDNVEYATPEGSLPWYILNASVGFQLRKQFQIQASVENIFDRHYRVFSSGLSAPGRNYIISLKGSF